MHFDLQPVLEGEMTELLPLKESDRDKLFAVASDPLIWEQHPQRDRYQRHVFNNFFADSIKSKGTLLVLDSKTKEAIGSSRYYDLNPAQSVAIGYTFLSRSCWGKGHNQEMKRLMLDHAFQYVESVIFHVGENNMRSRKAMEKIGARLVGRIDRKLADGSPNPSVVFEMTRPTN
ncbi:MAG: GNAT family N-acetyltransferase [Proteobacteria bacterium]|nr:GNAT family N-acetyltransferase [Pseudomonadota bacterium]